MTEYNWTFTIFVPSFVLSLYVESVWDTSVFCNISYIFYVYSLKDL